MPALHTSSAPIPSAERASLLVLGMAAFMVQADARVIDPLLHVVATDFHTTPPNAAILCRRGKGLSSVREEALCSPRDGPNVSYRQDATASAISSVIAIRS
jgi:hypothetical protein